MSSSRTLLTTYSTEDENKRENVAEARTLEEASNDQNASSHDFFPHALRSKQAGFSTASPDKFKRTSIFPGTSAGQRGNVARLQRNVFANASFAKTSSSDDVSMSASFPGTGPALHASSSCAAHASAAALPSCSSPVVSELKKIPKKAPRTRIVNFELHVYNLTTVSGTREDDKLSGMGWAETESDPSAFAQLAPLHVAERAAEAVRAAKKKFKNELISLKNNIKEKILPLYNRSMINGRIINTNFDHKGHRRETRP